MEDLPATDLKTEDLSTDAANWMLLQDLYHLLETTPEEHRASTLERATTDPVLRGRVLSLLTTATMPADASFQPAAVPPGQEIEIVPGQRVGPYSILRHLGSGGLGSVYLIERMIGGAIQPCALKVLAMRSLDPSFRARFEREQHILATLQHPNITHLLDAGISEAGQPYLVMEYVDGVDLKRFCDEGRLTIRQRLEIFLAICEAVRYAHSKLVVHLDLKPSNVLVTPEGEVKLLDFGTSKWVDADGAMTTTIMATPAYASPEQLRGEPVTTGCDVYSLGMMLYELLAGQRPFQVTSAAAAMHRATSEQEPPRLTTAINGDAANRRGLPAERLRRLLRGDLSSIVARCLRSRARDRYSSVEALAEDVRLHLAGRPVLARRQTTTYRLTKFIRRNRLALSAGSGALLLLAALGIFAYRRQQQALEQGRRAEQMQVFLSQLIRLANERQTGKPSATVTEFLELGVKVLPDMIQDAGDRRAAQLSLGESMYDSRDFSHALPVLEDVAKSARLAHDAATEAEASAFAGLSATSLGNSQVADAMTERALSLAHARGVGPPTRIWAEAAWGVSHFSRDVDRARSIALLEAGVRESSAAGVPSRERLYVLERLALIDLAVGRYAAASALGDEAYAMVRDQPYMRCDQATILQLQANLVSMGKRDDLGSLPLYRRAIEAAADCSGPESSLTLSIESLLARALTNVGQYAQTITLLEPAIPIWRKLDDGPSTAVALVFLARAYQLQGDNEQAESYARQAISAQQGKVAENGTRMAVCHLVIAESLAGRKRYPSALAEAELTNQIYDRIPTMSPLEESFHAQARALLRNLQAQAQRR